MGKPLPVPPGGDGGHGELAQSQARGQGRANPSAANAACSRAADAPRRLAPSPSSLPSPSPTSTSSRSPGARQGQLKHLGLFSCLPKLGGLVPINACLEKSSKKRNTHPTMRIFSPAGALPTPFLPELRADQLGSLSIPSQQHPGTVPIQAGTLPMAPNAWLGGWLWPHGTLSPKHRVRSPGWRFVPYFLGRQKPRQSRARRRQPCTPCPGWVQAALPTAARPSGSAGWGAGPQTPLGLGRDG